MTLSPHNYENMNFNAVKYRKLKTVRNEKSYSFDTSVIFKSDC